MQYVNLDEHKLIKFNTMRNKESNQQKKQRENAENIKNKLFKAAQNISADLADSESETGRQIKAENQRIEEEEKERDLGTFLDRNTQRRDLEDEFKDDENDSNTEDVLTSPILKENPFLYLGFGINLYFDFQLILILTLGIISILCIPIYKIMGSRQFYPVESWDVFSLGNFGSSKASCASSSLLADNFGAL